MQPLWLDESQFRSTEISGNAPSEASQECAFCMSFSNNTEISFLKELLIQCSFMLIPLLVEGEQQGNNRGVYSYLSLLGKTGLGFFPA